VLGAGGQGLTSIPRFEPAASGPEAVVAALATDGERGLDSDEAARRLAEVGPNELPRDEGTGPWRRFLGHFADTVVYLLLAAIVVALAAWIAEGAEGVPLDVITIALIVGANAVIGFVQESRAEQAVAALRDLTTTEATVVRDGERRRVPAPELVPGDVVLLAQGDVVPADGRLVEVGSLQVAEAALTGESLPVAKRVEPVASGAALGDRLTMVHTGTGVASGRGRAVVTATGPETEVGRIATLLGETEDEPTPLQREIDQVGRVLALSVVVIAVVVVATLVVVDDRTSAGELLDGLLIGVSLAVAAVPEGLPAVLSVVLALGVHRMSTRNALVKRLASVETLGSATVICTDKTGTLTRNEMAVRSLVLPSGELLVSGEGYEPTGQLHPLDGAPIDPSELADARFALTVGSLAGDGIVSARDGRFQAVGDPTEAAVVTARLKAGVGDGNLERRYRRREELPFTADRKRMSAVVDDLDGGGRTMLVVKGAPDVLLERCTGERLNGTDVALDEERRRWWFGEIDRLAGQAYRTLAMAYRPLDSDGSGSPVDESVERELVLLAVLGIIDPPREEAREAVLMAERAGVRVVMITGDHPGTAVRIASELGIRRAGDPVMTGPEIEACDDAALAEAVGVTPVFARVAPEHKLRIVRALQARGEVAAMTGDGVNDAPALRAADIGIAMGLTGTDVSKEAADMILTDDNFATIVSAVREGRAIFHNIRSFLRYLLSSNAGEVLTVFVGVLFAGLIGLADPVDGGVAAPLLAVQILWVNLVTDAAPALALGVDPAQPGLMERRPRRSTERVIDGRMQVGVGLVGLVMAFVTLLALDLRLPGGIFEGDADLATARTTAFTVLVLAQLFNTVNARSDTESCLGRLLDNPLLVAALALSAGLQVAVVHLPFLNKAFATAPLGIRDWVLAAVLASAVVWVAEARKWVLRRRTPVAELD